MDKQEFLNEAEPLAKQLLSYVEGNNDFNHISDMRVDISAGLKATKTANENEIIGAESGQTFAVAVQLFMGDRTIRFAQNGKNLRALKKAIDDNASFIHLVPETPHSALTAPEDLYQEDGKNFDVYDHSDVSGQDLEQYALILAQSASNEPQIKTLRSAGTSQSINHNLSLATNGLRRQKSSTVYSASAAPIAEDENGYMESGGDYAAARYYSDLPVAEELGKSAAKDATDLLGATKPETMENVPIVLSPDAAQTFFRSVYSAIDGGAVFGEKTFLKDKLGQQVMHESVTLRDDPHINRAFASSAMDSAGLETKPITFIENGVLKSFNMSSGEARLLGQEPIGRNDGPMNSSILPGDATPEELMSDIQDGVYIKGFMGGTADINTGLHSRQAYGLRIKDGKLTDERLNGFIVGGDLKDMFMDLALGNDTPQHPAQDGSSLLTPTTRINGMTISGANL